MKKILLIGCGHMGSALLKSWSKNKLLNISVVDPITHKKIKKIDKKILTFKSLLKVKRINQFDVIIFAVKPQIIKQVVSEFSFLDIKKALIISIVAGKKINFFKKNLSKFNQIVRAMPNMPASIEQGVTCLISSKYTSKKNKTLATNLFQSVGKVVWIKNETDLDKVTAVSGSGPAYYFLFIEHLISAANNLGLNKKIAEELVFQTGLGSISLLLSSKNTATNLRKSIAVKGGTTEAALNIFQKKNQFKNIIKKALKEAYNQSKKLGNN